jgi:uncharacterized protein
MKTLGYKIALGFGVLLLGLFVLRGAPMAEPLAAQGEPPAEGEAQRTISVSGTGEAAAHPDTAVATLGVETEAENAEEALDQNTEQMEDLLDALAEAGIPSQDIQTQAIRLNPRHEEVRRTEPNGERRSRELVGYRALNTVEVRVRDIGMLGTLLDTAVEAGGNRIQSIRFEVSDAADLVDEAREAAWEDAEHKAEQLVELAGAELGNVLTINESGQTPRPVVRERLEAEAAAVPVEPGTETISVDVQVTWLLE